MSTENLQPQISNPPGTHHGPLVEENVARLGRVLDNVKVLTTEQNTNKAISPSDAVNKFDNTSVNNSEKLSLLKPVYRKLAITGASGYLGSKLLNFLSNELFLNYNILAIDSSQSTSRKNAQGQVESYSGNILDKKALAAKFNEFGVESVAHLAKKTVIGHDKEEADSAYVIEVEGTKAVVEACVAAGVKHLVVLSSDCVYGYYPHQGRPALETNKLIGHPEIDHANNKIMVEYILAQARRQYPQLKQTIFRVPVIMGKNKNSPLLNLFLEKTILAPSNYEPVYSLVSENDVLNALALGLVEGRFGIYNLAADGAVSLSDIAKVQGKVIKRMNFNLLRTLLKLSPIFGLSSFDAKELPFLFHHPILANTALKTVFGYTPPRNAMQILLDWFEKL